MADEEHRAIRGKGGSGDGCPVQMYAHQRCGRAIHSAPDHDQTPVCLMHSRDPKKNDTEFQEEIEAILRAAVAEDGVADFTGFVFRSADYSEFTAKCVFAKATFAQFANFWGAEFRQEADFSGATFMREADFMGATFTQDACFIDATFTQKARFTGATFTQKAKFADAAFTQDADFSRATFTQDAWFNRATFTQDASFSGARFRQEATFANATFTQKADFPYTSFTQLTEFTSAKFMEAAEFHETKFRGHAKGKKDRANDLIPGPTFSLAEFSQPERVRFYKTYLGQTLFYNCDVSKIVFSSVGWRQRKGSLGKRMVLEEVVALDHARDLKVKEGSPDEREYALIAELYQQLKKNYDERRDYWTAGDFHYGEMEMKRMATKPPGPVGRMLGQLHFRMRGTAFRGLSRAGLDKLRAKRVTKRLPKRVGLTKDLVNDVWRWWHRHFSLVAWYKYASQYGESYARPLLCLALVLLLFTFLFPIVGLDWNDTKSPSGGTSVTPQTSSQTANSELSYGHFTDFVKAYNGRKWLARPAFFGNSLMTALSVAGFQKELKYEPSYPWGRALALLELLLTSTLAALFLLAVRRQFRR